MYVISLWTFWWFPSFFFFLIEEKFYMHACVSVCMSVCDVCMYVRDICTDTHACMCVCMHVCVRWMHVCVYMCVYVYTYVCMYVMYVQISVFEKFCSLHSSTILFVNACTCMYAYMHVRVYICTSFFFRCGESFDGFATITVMGICFYLIIYSWHSIYIAYIFWTRALLCHICDKQRYFVTKKRGSFAANILAGTSRQYGEDATAKTSQLRRSVWRQNCAKTWTCGIQSLSPTNSF